MLWLCSTYAYVIFPKNAGVEGLQQTVDTVFASGDSFDKLVTHTAMKTCNVVLELPIFEVDSGITLMKETLKEMGMIKPFQSDAELGRIAPDIFFNNVLHVVKMQVGPKGTVAAAAAGFMASKGIGGPYQIDIKINRPFLFVVYDLKAKVSLFVAKVESLLSPDLVSTDSVGEGGETKRKRTP